MWLPRAATAAPILDQNIIMGVENAFIVSFDQNLSQTFTVGISGILSEFAIDVGDREIGGSPLVWSIRRGLFSGTLATGVLTHDDVPFKSSFVQGGPFPPVDLTHVDVSSFGLRVSEGEQLYLHLDTGDFPIFGQCFPYCWTFTKTGYPRGEAFVIHGNVVSSLNGDLLFQTFVDPDPSLVPVPEPATATLLLCGAAAGLGGAARARKRRKSAGHGGAPATAAVLPSA
jgi:hypothetical protein